MLNLQSPRVRVAAIAIGALFVAASTQLDWIKQVKNKPFVDVREYGAVCDNSHDDTLNIQAAIAAAQARGGGTVYFPVGICKITAPIIITASGVVLKGQGIYSTFISQVSNLDAVQFTGSGYINGNGINDLMILAQGLTSTHKYALNLTNVQQFTSYNLETMYGMDAIEIDAGQDVKFYNLEVVNYGGSGNGKGMLLTGTGNGLYIHNGHFISANSGGPEAGIFNYCYSGITIESSDFYQVGIGISLSAGPGCSLDWGTITDTSFDTGTIGVAIIPSATGSLNGWHFINLWASSNSSAGVYIDGSTGGGINGLDFVGNRIYQNGAAGFQLVGGTNTQKIALLDSSIGGNVAQGVLLQHTLSSVKIANNVFGKIKPTFNTQAIGIYIAYGAMVSNVEVIGNNLVDNTAPAAFYTMPTIAKDNLGYNPVGASSITVTASPFTYTAGPAPEVVYISGTITSATRNGYGVCPALTAGTCTVILPPNGAVVVTYASTAPTMVKDIQ